MKELISEKSWFYSWVLLTRARHLVYIARQRELAPTRLTPRQSYTLFLIKGLGREATLTNIARYANREANTLSLQFTRMERDGLLKKIKAMPKSNSIRYELTPKGEKANIFSNKNQSVNYIMSILSKEEDQQLRFLLNKIVNRAKEYLQAQREI